MKRIAILIGLALLADVEPVLAQGVRGGSHAAGSGRSIAGYTGGSIAGYTGGSVAGYTGSSSPRHGGRPVVNQRPGGHPGHGGHQGHHRPPVGIVFPWWWHYHYGYHRHYSNTVIVTAPVYVPVYPPVYPPAYSEPISELRYFCPDYRDYYPNVASCPSQWLQVVPQAVTTTSY
jgi:hypothetical protein